MATTAERGVQVRHVVTRLSREPIGYLSVTLIWGRIVKGDCEGEK